MKPAAANSPLAADLNARWAVWAVCISLAAMVWVVFGQTVHYQFVNYDDDVYVTENPMVQKGLTWAGCRWALTAVYSANWHPVTWLSHMLDCQFYGLNPGGHHLTSVLLHTATVILLFLVLRRLTGFLWRSAFVAAVFAIHPLRVESVAWVAERKDVLCGLFFVLTIGAYARYAQRPSPGRYLMVAWLFILALMSKPMAVTFPFVLLLLDYWPLKRFSAAGGTLTTRRLILEKLPLFALSGAACAITVFAQQDAMVLPLPLAMRINNALVSYIVYVKQMFYPVGLAIFYPYPKHGLASGKIIMVAVLLLAVSAAALAVRQSRPWFLTGWLWYLGMLVPVIGLLQVGDQAHADRYMYLSQIGLLLALTWLVAEWSGGWRHRRLVLGGSAAVILTALMLSARAQTACWRNSESLWIHTLACTTNNTTAHYDLGNALYEAGKTDEAISQFQQAVQLKPDFVAARNNLGSIFLQRGNVGEAIDQFEKVIQLKPDYAQAHYNLATAFIQKNDEDEAILHYQAALQIKHDFVEAQNDLAWELATTPRASLRDGNQAMELAQRANQLTDGTSVNVIGTLAAADAEAGRFDEAVQNAQKAVDLARASGQQNLVLLLSDQLKLYQAGQPYHRPTP